MATQDPRFLLTELINTPHYRGVVEHFTETLVSSRATSQLQNKGAVWCCRGTKRGVWMFLWNFAKS